MSSNITIGAAFICGTIALTLVVYGLNRRAFARQITTDTRDLAGSVIFRVSALHGLILALVFAQELSDFNNIRNDLVKEATAVADIYNDMTRYGSAEVDTIHAALSAYVNHVTLVEWPHLTGGGGLTAAGWTTWDTVYLHVLDLAPQTPREVALRNHMIQRAQDIAALRQGRDNSAINPMNKVFWLAALSGVILVAAPYFIYAPTPLHLLLLSLYGAYSGGIMFLIYAFSDPYAEPGALPPVAFERLLDTAIGGGT